MYLLDFLFSFPFPDPAFSPHLRSGTFNILINFPSDLLLVDDIYIDDNGAKREERNQRR